MNHISKKYSIEYLYPLLIVAYFLATLTWIFSPFKSGPAIAFLIKMMVPLTILLIYTKYELPTDGKILIFLYSLLALYCFFLSSFTEHPFLSLIATAKVLYPLLFFVALLLTVRSKKMLVSLCHIPPYMAILFSLQVIIVALLLLSPFSPTLHQATLYAQNHQKVFWYGVGGYAFGSQGVGSSSYVYRAQSFFGEPTQFGAFLEVSIFLSFGIYKLYQKRSMLIIAIISTIALLITFSMTALIAITSTIFLLLVYQYSARFGDLRALVIFLGILILFMIVAGYLAIATSHTIYNAGKVGLALGHAKTEVTVRFKIVNETWNTIRQFPLGGGITYLGGEILKLAPSNGGGIAPLKWFLYAGPIGLFLQVSVIFILFKSIILKAIERNQHALTKYIALAFISYTIHQSVAGNWFDPMWFFLVSSLIVSDSIPELTRPGCRNEVQE